MYTAVKMYESFYKLAGFCLPTVLHDSIQLLYIHVHVHVHTEMIQKEAGTFLLTNCHVWLFPNIPVNHFWSKILLK